MSMTYRCGACQATWAEDAVPGDCPRCGSRSILRLGEAGPPVEDHYSPPTARVAPAAVSSTSFTLTYWLGFAGVVAGVALLGAAGDDNQVLAAAGGLTLFASLVSLTTAYVVSLVKLYRGWDLIQPLRRVDWGEADMTTPGKAVGFLFIPFYNFYWTFVAVHGLTTRANKYMVLSKIQARPMGEGLAQTYCILNVCAIIPCVNYLIIPVNIVLYYLFILDVDRMRAAVREGLEAGPKADFIDDIEAL